jgi:acetate kinase
MGFTPLEGLVMGSRCGDIDPALPGYIAAALNLDGAQLEQLLQQQSGLLGLCGDADMRRIQERRAAGDGDARLAFDIFCYRVRKYIGAYYAALNGLDALVFTAGIGEHSAAVREAVCTGMEALGIGVDIANNAAAERGIADIGRPDLPVRVLVVPTDEELEIARATHACLRKAANANRSSPGFEH